jgi:hypothetical protein
VSQTACHGYQLLTESTYRHKENEMSEYAFLDHWKPRDPSRIPVILTELQARWLREPDLRLTQLLVNLIRPQTPCPEIFYFEDQKLLELLQDQEKTNPS